MVEARSAGFLRLIAHDLAIKQAQYPVGLPKLKFDPIATGNVLPA
jgi:hypothetical protein